MFINNTLSLSCINFLLCLNLAFTAGYVQHLNATPPPITTCHNTSLTFAAPLSPPYHTDSQQGFIDQFVKLIFADIGCKVNIITLPAMRALNNTNNGKLDGIFLFSNELDIQEYSNLIKIQPSYFNYFLAFAGFGKLPESTQEISNYRVTTIRGMSLPHTLSAHEHIFQAKDLIQITTLLKRNRVDIAIIPVAIAYFYKQQNCFRSLNIKVYSELNVNLYIYLHKRHGPIENTLSNSVRRLKRSKKYQQLLQNSIKEGLNIPLPEC
ncbi:hypothetical protein [Spartinivicinus ruber]|uniref:hypothetical protein n=1 Tax=Spartinivicinus ruber TaxID=2683272 RepID=UPI0013D3807C|nr:hypothetical protein [Spartinivicinus ruber]